MIGLCFEARVKCWGGDCIGHINLYAPIGFEPNITSSLGVVSLAVNKSAESFIKVRWLETADASIGCITRHMNFVEDFAKKAFAQNLEFNSSIEVRGEGKTEHIMVLAYIRGKRWYR